MGGQPTPMVVKLALTQELSIGRSKPAAGRGGLLGNISEYFGTFRNIPKTAVQETIRGTAPL